MPLFDSNYMYCNRLGFDEEKPYQIKILVPVIIKYEAHSDQSLQSFNSWGNFDFIL